MRGTSLDNPFRGDAVLRVIRLNLLPPFPPHRPAWRALLVIVALAILATSGIVARAEESHNVGAKPPVDFNKQIRPILTQYCSSCHGGVKQAGDLSFVYADKVLPPDGFSFGGPAFA